MGTNVNSDLYDSSVDRAAGIALFERHLQNRVTLIVDDHAQEVEKLISNAKLDRVGYLKLRDALDKEIFKVSNRAFVETKQGLLGFAKDQMDFRVESIKSSIGRIWYTKRPSRSVAEELVLTRPLQKDATLERGWRNLGQAERGRITRTIRKGMAAGDSSTDIALKVKKTGAQRLTYAQARSLTTTAITSVESQADLEVYKANRDSLQGWLYVSILDSATTQICLMRNAQVYSVDEVDKLPPAHYGCRSTTSPVVKHHEDLAKLEGLNLVKKRNLARLTPKQRTYYDGVLPSKELYGDWLRRQTKDVQVRHLGSEQRVNMFVSGSMSAADFATSQGKALSLSKLRSQAVMGRTTPGSTKRFADAKDRLDQLSIGASTPEDFFDQAELAKNLKDYYLLQSRDLDGVLSLTNYRGIVLGNKRATKRRVMENPPREEQVKFNPITGRYEDIRRYQPAPEILQNNLRLMNSSELLNQRDKDFINNFVEDLSKEMSVNERAVIADNLRITFTRYRKNGEVWKNFKAVAQAQIKFDVNNVSDAIETNLRKDSDVIKKIMQDNYVDPVLGNTQMDDIHDNFIGNILAKNSWEDKKVPKIARKLRSTFDYKIPLYLRRRINESEITQFYQRFAQRLSLADSPDRDQFAIQLGRDIYNMANLNGDRNSWYKVGDRILKAKNVEKFFEIETFGVQKRRMKSRMSGQYFGAYYDTMSYNIRVTDADIQKYAKLTRKVDLGMRVASLRDSTNLYFREGYKTYFTKTRFGQVDTRIPITSTSSFSDFPTELIDKDLVEALNWTSQSKYKIDNDFYDFIRNLLAFRDDKGQAKLYESLNEYKHFMAGRGDAYERFKGMEWLRNKDAAFSNKAFLDHRGRIYEKALIGPQSGESFRPFLNSAEAKNFSANSFRNYEDQVGAFLGGLDDVFEGSYNGLTVSGRQAIAASFRKDLVNIGNLMIRSKPNDLRKILNNRIVKQIEGEELGKFFRFAIESAKIDNYLDGNYSTLSLERLNRYKMSLALEQDASSSGAQIIALTTRNKQLAELSNVVPTNQKRRLYDEIAAATYNDDRFKALNVKLQLTEKDLRKAAKAQNMVTFYGAGERTAVLNVEGKLAKILDRQTDTLVVKAADRDTVLAEISARAARYKKLDLDTYNELMALRKNVKDVFDKGLSPGNELMEDLYFLDKDTKQLVLKMTRAYENVVTPNDFKAIAKIMSEKLSEEVPILKDFTKFFGRLAQDFMVNAKPSKAAFDWVSIGKRMVFGAKKKSNYILPDFINLQLGLKPGEPVTENILKRLHFWKPDGVLSNLFEGVVTPESRRTGTTFLTVEIAQIKKLTEFELFYANKMPKSWTNVPWVNFDGKIIEQNFTQRFEERLRYQNSDGQWTTNIIQVPQKTEATWWEQAINKSGKINDIGDATRARTAYAVNGNHSNDATLVKNFHVWGKKNKISTSTIHDAFFTNASDMVVARKALRELYAKSLNKNSIELTLKEMLNRGLPKDLYNKYMEEAIRLGLIPVPGKSVVGGKIMQESDILKKEDILEPVEDNFSNDRYWYGVG